MPFISKLTVDLCRLLQVKHLRTSLYHPQMDDLVERFNQTLKQMLRWVVDDNGGNSDLLSMCIPDADRGDAGTEEDAP